MTESEIQQGDKVSWNWGSGKPSGEVAEVKEHGEIAIESHRGNTIKKNASPDDPAVHIARSGNDVVKRASELQVDKKAEGANGASNGEAAKEEDKPAPAEAKEDKPPESEKKDVEMKETPTEETKETAQSNGDSKAEVSKEETKEVAQADEKPAEKAKTTKATEKKAGNKRKAEDSLAEKANGADATDDKPAEKKTKTDDAEGEGAAPAKGKKAGRPKKEKKEPAKKKQPKKAATADGEPRRSGRNKA